jgi:cytochrome bd-type quinol oxidase subunit 1
VVIFFLVLFIAALVLTGWVVIQLFKSGKVEEHHEKR